MEQLLRTTSQINVPSLLRRSTKELQRS